MVRVESMAERRESSATVLEGTNEVEEDDEGEAVSAAAAVAPVSDPLPPYVPPPPPAVVVSHVRATSSESARVGAGSPSRL